MSSTQSFRRFVVLCSLGAGVLAVASCSSDDDAADGGGQAGGSAGKGGTSGSSAGKAGMGSGGGAIPIAVAGSSGSAGRGANGGSTSAGAGGTSGAAAEPECAKEADCGAGQTCVQGKCAVKPCSPPPTAFQLKPDVVATSVSLAGSHNAWSTTASPLALDAGSGYWKGSFQLAAGTYQYKFVIDGATWLPDPANTDTVDDGFCGFNSQITIGCDGVEPAQGVHGDGCPPDGSAGEGGGGGASAAGAAAMSAAGISAGGAP